MTPQGRLVILDFGIISDLQRVERWNQYRTMGTVAYMAPEQAEARPVGPAADWYSIGVVLYEALTGTLPYLGQPAEILERKRREPAPAPSTLVPGIPPALDELCAALLSIDPAARPTGDEILRRLQVAQPAAADHGYTAPHAFIGRQKELATLDRAFTDSRRGQAVTVQVHGESGVGKSFLVRHFLETITRAVPETVLLCGRCYERELVPYKAVDGVVDQLSRYLAQLPEAEARALLPRNLQLVAKLFPVLEPMAALAPTALAAPEDPVVLRTRAFLALRELLRGIAQRAPLVLMIDDLQWADTDSFVLLGELLRLPEPPPLLLLTTVRQSSGVLDGDRALAQSRLPGDVRSLLIGKLPAAEARELVQLLLASPAEDGAEVAALIAQEAKGHPLFIDELVRQRRLPGQQGASLRLDDALWARVRKLDPPVRQLLEAVAVAGAPIAQEVIASAAAVSPEQFDALTAQLRAAHLVRTAGARQKDTIVTYHDRVRESILTNLAKESCVAWHNRLAVALESAGAAAVDPEALLIHWQEAGQLERAAGYASRAADQAAATLAFARAASLYKQALELHSYSGAARCVLLAKLGSALTNANRGAEAAPVFLLAAADAGQKESCDLQRRAADEFLISGHLEEGLRVLAQVLAAVGLKLGSNTAQVLASLYWRRARLKLRGLQFTPRSAQQIPTEQLLRIDVCWAVARGLGMVDPIRTADFQTLHLLLALEAGEPYRVTRALALELAYRSSEGGPSQREVNQLAAAAQELAGQVNDPHITGLVALFTGMAHFLRGDWRRALELQQQAQSVLLERCTGVAWEWALAHRFALGSLMYLGELRELQQRVAAVLADARETGNLYTATDVRLRYNLAWLAADDPRGAKRALDEGLADWSSHGFHIQHYQYLLGNVQLALYLGDARAGWERLEKEWSRLKRSLLLRVQLVRIEALHLRGRGALAMVAQGEPVALLKYVEAAIAKLDAERMAWSDVLSTLLRAGLACCRGDRPLAVQLLRAAVADCERNQMALHAAAARWRLAETLPADSDEAGELRAQAQRFMAAQELRSPPRLIAMLVPGFPPPAGGAA